jgi:signal-transduction protein with cAMP-binding, CBS, and nucleotidyltransferase domain
MNKDDFAVNAYQKMKEHHINHIIALRENEYFGIVHIQDLINEGIV